MTPEQCFFLSISYSFKKISWLFVKDLAFFVQSDGYAIPLLSTIASKLLYLVFLWPYCGFIVVYCGLIVALLLPLPQKDEVWRIVTTNVAEKNLLAFWFDKRRRAFTKSRPPFWDCNRRSLLFLKTRQFIIHWDVPKTCEWKKWRLQPYCDKVAPSQSSLSQ